MTSQQLPVTPFFAQGSPFLAHPLLTLERTVQEIDFIEYLLNLSGGMRVLDVGCGFGRHSVELARRGYEVVGIDPAAAMIEAARELARKAAVPITFHQIHAEQFETERRFDAAICLFTSLGQISEQGENSGLVDRVNNPLKQGGSFMVDVPQRDMAVAQLRPSDKFGDGDSFTAVTREFDPDVNIATEVFRVVNEAESQSFKLQYHLYTKGELVGVIEKAGFAIEAIYGGYDGLPLTDGNPIMIVFGRKE